MTVLMVVMVRFPMVLMPPEAAPTKVLLSASGDPRLATAGTGDVLSGMIGAFIARGAPGVRGGGPGRACPRTGGADRVRRGPGGRRPPRSGGGLVVKEP